MKVEVVKITNIDEKVIACGIYTSVIESIAELIVDFLTCEENICEEFATEAVANMKPDEMADIIKYILTEHKTQNDID